MYALLSPLVLSLCLFLLLLLPLLQLYYSIPIHFTFSSNHLIEFSWNFQCTSLIEGATGAIAHLNGQPELDGFHWATREVGERVEHRLVNSLVVYCVHFMFVCSVLFCSFGPYCI